MTIQQKQRVSTPTEQLRQALDRLEAQIGKLDHDTRDEILKIPSLFDTAHTLLTELTHKGMTLTAETSRYKTASAQFQKKGGVFLRKIGGAHVLEALREERAPDSERWWWYIDRWLADQKRNQLRRQGKSLLIGIAIFAVLTLLYALFLAPDKATRARISHQQAAESFATNGDYEQALDEVSQSLSYAPDDLDLLILKGVMEQHLGRATEAEATFEAAEAVADSRRDFLLARAQAHHILKEPKAVLADAQAAVALDPEAPYGYFYIAQAYLSLGNFPEAEANFEKTATLAKAAGETELEAIARIQIGYLYQMMASQPQNTPQEAP